MHNIPLKQLPKMTDSIIYPPNMDYDYFSVHEDYPFNPKKIAFDACCCWWMSEFSLISYEHPKFIKLALASTLGVKSEIVGIDNFQSVVAYNDDWIVVAFRGTRIKSIGMLKDLSYGALVKPIMASQYGKIHQGFFDSYQKVWLDTINGAKPIVKRLIKEKNSRQLWFTGHSLGGAIAVLAAIDMQCENPVYTFGCPKIGDTEFAGKLNIKHYRIVNRNDIVVQFPPKFSKYLGKSVYSNDGFVYQILNNSILPATIENKTLLKYFDDMLRTNRKAIFRLFLWEIPRSVVKYLVRVKVMKFVSILTDAMYEILFKDMVDHAPVLYAISSFNNLIKSASKTAI